VNAANRHIITYWIENTERITGHQARCGEKEKAGSARAIGPAAGFPAEI
jgi:hypothetical protein